MRGGFVVCLGGDRRVLDHVVEAIRWHRTPSSARWEVDDLAVAAYVDEGDGPGFETRGGRTLVTHGAPPAPIAELQRGPSRFAALEWDGHRLRASRDPMGLAPLFFRRHGGGVWLASEVWPLLALGRTGADLEALAARTAFAPLDDRTGWQDVLRVLPGWTLTVEPDRTVSSVPYWTPGQWFGRYRGDRAGALDAFRERFRDAVARCRAPRTAVLLSGGLDSSAVALAAPAPSSLHLVHVHFRGLPETHEDAYARTVARAAGAPLHTIPGDESPWDVAAELEGWGLPYNWLPYGMEDPALAHARASGIPVALDGHDGDGALGPAGSEWGDLILRGSLGRLMALTRGSGVGSLLRGAAIDLLPPWAWLRRVGGYPPRRPTYLQEVTRYFQEPLRSRIIEADIDRWRWPRARWRTRQLLPLLPRATVAFEQKEIEAARFGIDMRHPFADRDLVELLLSLPSAVKVEPGRSKAILRDAFQDLLPADLERRAKSDYVAVVRRRVDPARCLDSVCQGDVRLPHVEYGRLRADAETDPFRVPLFLTVNLTRMHEFVRRARDD